MIRKGLLTLTVATGALMFASQANADFVNFYGSIDSGKVQKIDSGSKVFGPILATTGQTSAPSGSRPMTIAHQGGANPDELGIGVCGASDGGSLCPQQEGIYNYSGNWSGDPGDELENLRDDEWVKLTSDAMTGQFLLGSFDHQEAGNITWVDGGTTRQVTFQHNLNDTASIIDYYNVALADLDISRVYGNVFLLSIADFSTDAMVTFMAGCGSEAVNCSVGSDNDYLVAGASVVPIPAALPLFLSALGGLGLIGWRRKGARTA
jgi:hypothetical protein